MRATEEVSESCTSLERKRGVSESESVRAPLEPTPSEAFLPPTEVVSPDPAGMIAATGGARRVETAARVAPNLWPKSRCCISSAPVRVVEPPMQAPSECLVPAFPFMCRSSARDRHETLGNEWRSVGKSVTYRLQCPAILCRPRRRDPAGRPDVPNLVASSEGALMASPSAVACRFYLTRCYRRRFYHCC